MAAFSFDDASVVYNSVDLSDHVTTVTISASADELEDSAMGDSWRTFLQGVKSFDMTLEFNDDYAASEVDATLWAAFNTGTNVTVVFKPTSASVSATNPSYTGSVVPQPGDIGGGYGDLTKRSVTLRGSGALTRATA